MKVNVVVEAYKGCIENVHVFEKHSDAEAKLDAIRKGPDFNEDEDDAQIFDKDVIEAKNQTRNDTKFAKKYTKDRTHK
jgi:hypothetical protein